MCCGDYKIIESQKNGFDSSSVLTYLSPEQTILENEVSCQKY